MIFPLLQDFRPMTPNSQLMHNPANCVSDGSSH